MLAFIKIVFFCWVVNDYVDKEICNKIEQKSMELPGSQLKPEMISSVFLKRKGMPMKLKNLSLGKKKNEQE